MDIFTAIHNRRSIRRYKPDMPDDETVKKLLDAARWAPSWANTQCVRYVIVKDKATKEKLSAALSPGNPAAKAVLDAPLVVVFVAELGVAGCKKGLPVDDKAWYMFDTGVAMQNFALAAHAEGLGTVVCGAFDYKAAAQATGVPVGFQVVAFTPLGFPDGGAKAPPRKEIGELARYGNPE